MDESINLTYRPKSRWNHIYQYASFSEHYPVLQTSPELRYLRTDSGDILQSPVLERRFLRRNRLNKVAWRGTVKSAVEHLEKQILLDLGQGLGRHRAFSASQFASLASFQLRRMLNGGRTYLGRQTEAYKAADRQHLCVHTATFC